jgi:hypothetical protein
MSDFRIEKRLVEATVLLDTGARRVGAFFLTETVGAHLGPEGLHDLLNGPDRFIPFRVAAADGYPEHDVILNRARVVVIRLGEDARDPAAEMSLGISPRRYAKLVLATGDEVAGNLRISLPAGRDRVSDYANSGDAFARVEQPAGPVFVNLDYVVEIVVPQL